MALDTQSAAAIQQLIRDRFDATAEVATRKKLLPILRQAEKELEARLAKAAASGQPFTAAQASAYRVQIRSTVAALSKHVGEAVGDLSGEASAESVHSLMTQMKMAQAALGASPAPEVALSLPEIARLSGAFGQNTSLLKHFLDRGNASALNYGKDLIGDFEGLIAKGLATGKTTDQVSTELLTANTGFKGAWWKAERIARTEVSYAYNVTAREGSKKLGEAFPDVLNRWVEYVDDDSRLGLDDRVGDDSLRLHGQLRRPGQPFHDVVNKRDVTEPPNRPNDRAALTVWRASWGEPPGGLDRLDRESQEAFGEALAAYEAWQKARTEEEERLREEERKKEEDAAKPEEYKIHPKAAYPLTGKFAAVRFPVSEQKAAEINAAYESLVSGKVAETTAEKEVQEALDYFTKELSGARYARDPTQLDPGPERDLAEKCNRIISVLAKRDLEEPTTLYRGIWAGERRALHVPGAIIDLGPGASFSTNPLTVNLFAGQRSGVIYVWEDCVQGADIAKISSRAENEILAGGAVEILSTEVDHAGRLICRVRRAAGGELGEAAEGLALAGVERFNAIKAEPGWKPIKALQEVMDSVRKTRPDLDDAGVDKAAKALYTETRNEAFAMARKDPSLTPDGIEDLWFRKMAERLEASAPPIAPMDELTGLLLPKSRPAAAALTPSKAQLLAEKKAKWTGGKDVFVPGQTKMALGDALKSPDKLAKELWGATNNMTKEIRFYSEQEWAKAFPGKDNTYGSAGWDGVIHMRGKDLNEILTANGGRDAGSYDAYYRFETILHEVLHHSGFADGLERKAHYSTAGARGLEEGLTEATANLFIRDAARMVSDNPAFHAAVDKNSATFGFRGKARLMGTYAYKKEVDLAMQLADALTPVVDGQPTPVRFDRVREKIRLWKLTHDSRLEVMASDILDSGQLKTVVPPSKRNEAIKLIERSITEAFAETHEKNMVKLASDVLGSADRLLSVL